MPLLSRSAILTDTCGRLKMLICAIPILRSCCTAESFASSACLRRRPARHSTLVSYFLGRLDTVFSAVSSTNRPYHPRYYLRPQVKEVSRRRVVKYVGASALTSSFAVSTRPASSFLQTPLASVVSAALGEYASIAARARRRRARVVKRRDRYAQATAPAHSSPSKRSMLYGSVPLLGTALAA